MTTPSKNQVQESLKHPQKMEFITRGVWCMLTFYEFTRQNLDVVWISNILGGACNGDTGETNNQNGISSYMKIKELKKNFGLKNKNVIDKGSLFIYKNLKMAKVHNVKLSQRGSSEMRRLQQYNFMKHSKIQIFFGGIVKPLMATWPFVINVKGIEKVWLVSINDEGGDWWIWLSLMTILMTKIKNDDLDTTWHGLRT